MKKLSLLFVVPLAATAIGVAAQGQRTDVPNVAFRHSFNIVEATIPEMQAALASGRVTSRELVLLYMSRIAQYEELLNATAYVSRTALDEAEQLDRERASGRLRGPLHGIPIALRTSSTRPTCPRPAARWPSRASCRRMTRRSQTS